jgi:hypothetical protein
VVAGDRAEVPVREVSPSKANTFHGLACDSNQLVGLSDTYTTNTGGAHTLAEAVAPLADPGGGVSIQDQTQVGATAYLLRADGTAYSKVGLLVLDDNTWRVDSMESCSGDLPPHRKPGLARRAELRASLERLMASELRPWQPKTELTSPVDREEGH